MEESREVPFPDTKRRSAVDLKKQQDAVLSAPAFSLLLELPVALLILNANRQIIYINEKGVSLLPPGHQEPIGARPGEAFSCVHAAEGEDGCGSSDFCRYCGAAKSLASALAGMANAEECSIEVRSERVEQLDLLVWANPFTEQGERFILFAVIDISAEKKRESFEQIFLHDLMNTAGSLSSLLKLMDTDDPSFAEYLELAQGAAEQLTDEIVSYRVLADAEDGLLSSERSLLPLDAIISSVAGTYARIAESRGISLHAPRPPLVLVDTDPVLLKRVLANLLKNAIEATQRGDVVSITCMAEKNSVRIEVKNPTAMDTETRAHVFQRSFSTKGRGRGLGTYSARLFVEDYLGGTISLESEAGKGTCFTVLLPLPEEA